jgi:hypothetical protein
MSLDGLLSTQGLFKSNYIIYLDDLGDPYKEWGADEYKSMHNSGHICILLAHKLNADTLRDIRHNSNKLVECKSTKPKGQYNIFNVASALKNRDKKRLWVELTMAHLNGSDCEGVVGMLFWAIKDMLLKRQYSKWSQGELEILAIVLAALPHKARRDGVSVHNALEYWVLSL